MSKLIIVESPSKIKSIKKILGSEYEVMASVGHVRDLPKSKLGVDVDNNFELKYETIANKKDTINKLREAAAKADFVYLATDPDREGEAISWHLSTLLALDLKAKNRVGFNEITKTGVENGMKAPRQIDLDLVDAQQARRALDRIVGYKLSPFLWKKVKRGLSAGRVQSVALKLIVDREKKIEAFNPEEYWTLDAKLLTGRKSFVAKFYGDDAGNKIDIANEQTANSIMADLEDAQYVVSSVKKGVRNRKPAPPFITSSLMQEASRKLNFTGQKTMRIAQQLYEGIDIQSHGTVGLITYMRTDSLRVSGEAKASAKRYIASAFGEKYLPKSDRFYKTDDNAQDAHEAIRPTDVFLTPDSVKNSLTAEQYKVYRLIWCRFVASLMANCVQNTISADIKAANYIFKASGYSVKFDGFTALYEEGRDEEGEDNCAIPENMQENDVLTLKDLISAQHFTAPPARYTEPTLIQVLKENGIGRPSTYATIMANIMQREYIEREKKSLKPTALGIVVSDLMAKHFKNIVDVKFTASVETDLDHIAAGELNWIAAMKNFYKDFAVELKKAEDELTGKKVKVPVIESDVVCDKCGRTMIVKTSRFGKFLACPGYPECKNTKPMPADDIKEPCPKCGGKLIKRVSKKTGKSFYGCAEYPKCNFAAPGLPTGKLCEKCGGFMIKGRGKTTYCINSDCESRKEKSSKKEK